MRRRNEAADFWSRVRRGGELECWEWQGSKPGRGYGQIRWGGAMRATHRMAWELTFGVIPPGMFICHKCDNPPCCNPSHLFLGTPLDNAQDREAKGRRSPHLPPVRPTRGESHPMAKLTNWQVLSMRKERLEGCKLIALASKYGISFGHVSAICRETRWSNVPVAEAQQIARER